MRCIKVFIYIKKYFNNENSVLIRGVRTSVEALIFFFLRFLHCTGTSKEQLKKSKHFLWFFISVFRVNNYIEKINSFLRICFCSAGGWGGVPFALLRVCFCYYQGIIVSWWKCIDFRSARSGIIISRITYQNEITDTRC